MAKIDSLERDLLYQLTGEYLDVDEEEDDLVEVENQESYAKEPEDESFQYECSECEAGDEGVDEEEDEYDADVRPSPAGARRNSQAGREGLPNSNPRARRNPRRERDSRGEGLECQEPPQLHPLSKFTIFILIPLIAILNWCFFHGWNP